MLTKAEIDAEGSTLDATDVANLVANIRTSDRYKANAGYFVDVQSKIEDLDGTVQAKQINAIIAKIELLGSGVVEINQSQTVGTDGVIYSKKLERDALIDYALNIMYEELFNTTTADDGSLLFLNGHYGVGRLPLVYKGYLCDD